jgi:hypothetical protein
MSATRGARAVNPSLGSTDGVRHCERGIADHGDVLGATYHQKALGETTGEDALGPTAVEDAPGDRLHGEG